MLFFPFDNFIDDSLERQHLNAYDEVDLILVTVAPPKTVLYLIVVGGVNSQVGECLLGLCHQG